MAFRHKRECFELIVDGRGLELKLNFEGEAQSGKSSGTRREPQTSAVVRSARKSGDDANASVLELHTVEKHCCRVHNRTSRAVSMRGSRLATLSEERQVNPHLVIFRESSHSLAEMP